MLMMKKGKRERGRGRNGEREREREKERGGEEGREGGKGRERLLKNFIINADISCATS